MNQSQFLAITCDLLQAREKSRVHGVMGFSFASHWLKNWRESFKSIIKRSNRNHEVTSFENFSKEHGAYLRDTTMKKWQFFTLFAWSVAV